MYNIIGIERRNIVDELDNNINQEYYWKEMYYNVNIREDNNYKDIYSDMEWWYNYIIKESELYDEE